MWDRPDWTFRCPKCRGDVGPGVWDNLCRGRGYITSKTVTYGIVNGSIEIWQKVGETRNVQKTQDQHNEAS